MWFVSQEAPTSSDPFCQPLHGQALPKVHQRTIQLLPTFARHCRYQKPQSLSSPVLCPVISQSLSWHFRLHLDFRRLVPSCRLTLSPLSHRHHQLFFVAWNNIHKDTRTCICISLISILLDIRDRNSVFWLSFVSSAWNLGLLWVPDEVGSLTTHLLSEGNAYHDYFPAADSICYPLLRLWEDVELKLRSTWTGDPWRRAAFVEEEWLTRGPRRIKRTRGCVKSWSLAG